MTTVLKKLSNIQTRDRIANILRREIISNRIKDKEQLTQEQIAQYLDVSRIPVREAFLILELEGFLIRQSNRHVIAVSPTAKMVTDVLELIALIEVQVIKNIISAQKTAKLNYQNEQQFHESLADVVENNYLKVTYSRLMNGFPHYIWSNNSAKPEAAILFLSLINAIQSIKLDDITNIVHQYYSSLTEVLVKEINGINNNE